MLTLEAEDVADHSDRPTAPDPDRGAGRRPSRARELLRGLRDSPAVPETIEQVNARLADWYRVLKPRNEFHNWLVDQVTVISIRVDRCERIERRLRDRHSLRAAIAWDRDRRHEAEVLGARLDRRPGEVVEALRRTPQGCDWLIGRWALLAEAADSRGAWTPGQAAIAFDLLGIPAEFREGRDVGPDGPSAVARREIAALRELREAVAELDEVDRALAEADLSDASNRELKGLRRYESGLHGRLRWCLAQLRYESPHPTPSPDIRPRWVERPEPKPEARPEPAPAPEARAAAGPPPVEAEPEGEDAERPAAPSDRRARRARKVEARREARKRRLRRLRA